MALPMNPTSHDFLITFFPEHWGHSIASIEPPTKYSKALVMTCSCGQVLAVDELQLNAFELSINKAVKGPLRNCILNEKA